MDESIGKILMNSEGSSRKWLKNKIQGLLELENLL